MSAKLLEDLFAAYYDARRHKRNTINQLRFELRLEDNILRLYHQLVERTYQPAGSVAFIIEEPVKREVFAARFADRVIHHLYFNYVNEIFERTFIQDCYSCRKGMGTSYAIERIDHHIRSCSENYTQDCYLLKLDLSGYFMSIDRGILYDKVISTLHRFADRRNAHGIRYRDLLDYDLLEFLSGRIIFNDPTEGCLIHGNRSEWIGLPADKSLFTTSDACGLPIGNLTSQLFSNVYLTEFDYFVKRDLKIKHYGRYVDDFFLVHHSREVLVRAIEQIHRYLDERLHIRLHPRKIYLQHFRRGISFVGVVIKPHRIYAAPRIIKNFNRALDESGKVPETFIPTLNSYLGLMCHNNNYRLRRTIVDHHHWLFNYGWMNVKYCKFTPERRVFPRLRV